jgi:hypothetical protein
MMQYFNKRNLYALETEKCKPSDARTASVKRFITSPEERVSEVTGIL